MTCDTSMLQGRGVSFALAEAALSLAGDPGGRGRWGTATGLWLGRSDGSRIWRHRLSCRLTGGICAAMSSRCSGCTRPAAARSLCNFCSVIKIAGRRIRGQSIATTLASLRAAKAGGVRTIMFTSDNFNKYPEAEALLDGHGEGATRAGVLRPVRYADREAGAPGGALAEAGCFQIFVGVESFNRQTLLAARKGQNRPEMYRDIVRLCRSTESARTFPTSSAFPRIRRKRCSRAPGDVTRVGPTLASFYIFCPIPGTEQYDDFHGGGAYFGEEPRPVRHDVLDMAPPKLFARAVEPFAVSVL